MTCKHVSTVSGCHLLTCHRRTEAASDARRQPPSTDLMRISLKSSQAERWDGSGPFFISLLLLWKAVMEWIWLRATGELRVGAAPQPCDSWGEILFASSTSSTILSFVFDCRRLVEEGGQHFSSRASSCCVHIRAWRSPTPTSRLFRINRRKKSCNLLSVAFFFFLWGY